MAADRDPREAVPHAAAGSRVDKPWGYEIRWAVTEGYLGKVLHVKRGEALSLQYHERKDECLYLAGGRLRLELDDEAGRLRTYEMGPGDTVRIRPGRRHRMTALEDCDVFEVSTAEMDDVVRLEDRYGRAGASQDSGGGPPGRPNS